jgi:hypothetical protein
VAAQGRLGNVQAPRALGKASELGDGDEVAEFPGIHPAVQILPHGGASHAAKL